MKAAVALVAAALVAVAACGSSTGSSCTVPKGGFRQTTLVLDGSTGDTLSRRTAPVDRRSHVEHPTTTTPYGDIDVSLAEDHQLRGTTRSGTRVWNTRLDHDLVVEAAVPLPDGVAVVGATTDESDDEPTAALVDPASGQLLWTRALPWRPVRLVGSPAALFVVLQGSFGKDVVVALDPATGRIGWEHSFDLPQNVDLGLSGDDLVVTADDSFGCA